MNKKKRNLKILFWDIEMSPGLFYGWDQFNPPFHQLEKTSISCVAYKWAHEKDVKTISLTKSQHKKNPRNEKVLVEKMIKVINQADLLVAHNGDKFDWKKLNARVIKYGLPPVKKPKLVDTLKMIKQEARFDSHRLGEVCAELGVPLKIETSKNLFTRAIFCWEAYKELVSYCVGDILALEGLFNAIRPYCKPILNTAALDGLNKACASCGSVDIIGYGTYLLASGKEVRRFKCKSCGSTKTRNNAAGTKTLTAI